MARLHERVRIGLGLLFLAAATTASAQNLYRYVDENGVTRMGTTIPAEYVHGGYEVLSSSGILLETVAPVLPATPEEVEANTIAQVEADQERADQVLLTSYSSTSEIAAHRDRKIDGINRQVENLKTDHRVLEEQLQPERDERQRYLDREQEVPEELTSYIDELESLLVEIDAQIVARSQEVSEIEAEFAYKIARFEVLMAQRRN